MSNSYLTYKDLSKRWSIAVNTLMQWVMAGQLKPSMRLRRLVRFSESYILEIESKGGIGNVGEKGSYCNKMASPDSIADHISMEDDKRYGLEIESKGRLKHAP